MHDRVRERAHENLKFYAILGRFFFLLTAIAALFTVPSFGGTKIVHRWVLAEQPLPKLHKVLVIAILENYLVRQELEDEMEELLAESGVEGIKSHMVLPPRNEMTEGELKDHIKNGDFDGVLVIRPKESRTETKEIVTGVAGHHYMPPPGYYHLWPYWNMAWGQANATSHFKESTIVRTEFNLYRAKDEKLLWTGEADTVYSKDFRKLGRDYAKTIVKQLKKDKVIGNK
jgi:hypothetical protein